MATTTTGDVEGTIEQVIRCADAGFDMVRITVVGMKEATACGKIREGLDARGYDIPLCADMHFQPKVAMKTAEAIEKIRINPGNFADGRKVLEEKTYDTDEEFYEEREYITEAFAPLVLKCKDLNRAMRIGTNHGSLSSRILSFYGDSPRGMVESAIEFADICRSLDYHNFVFSMKASNPVVMIQAYRLLAAEQYRLGWDYPIHLGVTEAGEGEDGRMKSAIGIGTLLADGLGDTIRSRSRKTPSSSTLRATVSQSSASCSLRVMPAMPRRPSLNSRTRATSRYSTAAEGRSLSRGMATLSITVGSCTAMVQCCPR
jgi:(E)-4-hydroxy-3-methylbut-2-enyl-diphosphate synthase